MDRITARFLMEVVGAFTPISYMPANHLLNATHRALPKKSATGGSLHIHLPTSYSDILRLWPEWTQKEIRESDAEASTDTLARGL